VPSFTPFAVALFTPVFPECFLLTEEAWLRL